MFSVSWTSPTLQSVAKFWSSCIGTGHSITPRWVLVAFWHRNWDSNCIHKVCNHSRCMSIQVALIEIVWRAMAVKVLREGCYKALLLIYTSRANVTLSASSVSTPPRPRSHFHWPTCSRSSRCVGCTEPRR